MSSISRLMDRATDTCVASRRDFFRGAAGAVAMTMLPTLASSALAAAPGLHVRVSPLDLTANKAPEGAGFRARVLRNANLMPMRLDAVYTQADHAFWHAWEQHGVMQYSSPSWARWAAPRASGLPMTLAQAGARAAFTLPAHAGIYLLTLAASEAGLPNVQGYALDTREGARTLVRRTDGAAADFPHLLLAVESLTA